MSKRNDPHSPTNLVTEDYEYVNAFDNQQPGWLMSEYAQEVASKVRKSNSDRGMSQCHHCGARIRYVAVMEYVPTGEYIAIGETCLENRFDRATADFQRLRKQAKLDQQQQRIRKAVALFAEENPDLAFLSNKDPEVFEAQCPEASRDNSWLRELSRKLNYYGSLFPNQIESARKSIAKDAEIAARKAAEALEVRGPVPVGRVEIEGVVVGIKFVKSYFGYQATTTKKLIVKLDNNSKVYVTEPASINSERGDRIALTCTIEASNDDPSFGFGKRPTKAAVIEEAS
jgi:hypothetical protein